MARVLIVDDTDIVRRALEIAVRRMGHSVASVALPEAALALALDDPPDLALLDFRMPGMDGVTLFEKLRASLGARCPKVLFVSGTPPEEVRARAKEAGDPGPIGYVKKPFHLDDLSRIVGEALA
jgi:CheY-like chemotaxis protein